MSDWLSGQGESPSDKLSQMLANAQAKYATVSAGPDPNLSLGAITQQQSNQPSQFPAPAGASSSGGDSNAALLSAIQGLAQSGQGQQPQTAANGTAAQQQAPAETADQALAWKRQHGNEPDPLGGLPGGNSSSGGGASKSPAAVGGGGKTTLAGSGSTSGLLGGAGTFGNYSGSGSGYNDGGNVMGGGYSGEFGPGGVF